jgi:hypothetical protein
MNAARPSRNGRHVVSSEKGSSVSRSARGASGKNMLTAAISSQWGFTSVPKIIANRSFVSYRCDAPPFTLYYLMWAFNIKPAW